MTPANTTQPTLRQRALAALIAQREAEVEAERQREVDRYSRHVGLLIFHLRTQLGIRITEDEVLPYEQPGQKDAPAYIEDDLLFVVDMRTGESGLLYSALCPGCQMRTFTHRVNDGLAGIGRQLEDYDATCGQCRSVVAA